MEGDIVGKIGSRVINKNCGYDIKSTVGEELYAEICGMLSHAEDKIALQKISKKKVKKVEEIYEVLKQTETCVLPLLNFLSLHELYNPKYKGLFYRLSKIHEKTNRNLAETMEYTDGYSDLIADEYKKLDIL